MAGAAWKHLGAGQETARVWYMTWRNQQLNQAIRVRHTPGPDRGMPGMYSFSEVRVLYGPGSRHRYAKARASPRGGV